MGCITTNGFLNEHYLTAFGIPPALWVLADSKGFGWLAGWLGGWPVAAGWLCGWLGGSPALAGL